MVGTIVAHCGTLIVTEYNLLELELNRLKRVMVHGLLQSCVVLALDQLGPGSFQPHVCGLLIGLVRYIAYNRVMAVESCQNLVNIDLRC